MSDVARRRHLMVTIQDLVKARQIGPEHIVAAIQALEAVINDVSSEPMALTLDLAAKP